MLRKPLQRIRKHRHALDWGEELTRECVANIRNELWSVLSLGQDGSIEILDRLAVPHAHNEENREACASSGKCHYTRLGKLTDHEAQDSNPSRSLMKKGGIKSSGHFARELVAEGDESERDQEDKGEGQSYTNECRCSRGRGRQEQLGCIRRQNRKI
jgi:hypothetical protein